MPKIAAWDIYGTTTDDNKLSCSLQVVSFAMVSLPTWFRYIVHKLEYSATISLKVLHFSQLHYHSLPFADIVIFALIFPLMGFGFWIAAMKRLKLWALVLGILCFGK